jgi:hypothetical protein
MSHPRTLLKVAVSLEYVHVIPDPLLDKYCKECCGKTGCEGHEPKLIYTDIAKRREGRRWCRGNGNLRGNGSDLLRDSRKNSGVLSEVIDHLICGANLQVLFAINHE